MTKDTREAIAQIIAEQAEIGVSGDAPLDPGVSNPEELADAILTALEPAQAGGDVAALVEALEQRMLIVERAEKGEGLSYPEPSATEIGCAKEDLADELIDHWDEIRTALTATPAQPTRSGEVGGLVAEIDAALARTNLLEELPWRPITSADEIRPDAPKAIEEINAAIALINAWPRIRTALGGGWRDDMENADG